MPKKLLNKLLIVRLVGNQLVGEMVKKANSVKSTKKSQGKLRILSNKALLKKIAIVAVIGAGLYWHFTKIPNPPVIDKTPGAYTKEVNITDSQKRALVRSMITEMAILNDELREFVVAKIAGSYGNQVKTALIIDHVLQYRSLIESFTDYLFRSGRVQQYNAANEILAFIAQKSDDDELVDLYAKLLNADNPEQMKEIFANVNLVAKDARANLEVAIIENSINIEKISFKKIKKSELSELEKVIYDILALKVYPYKEAKDIITSEKEMLKVIDGSPYPIYKKVFLISSLLNKKIQGNDEKIGRILNYLDKYYDELDKKLDLETFQAYLNIAHAFKGYSDVEMFVSYFLEAANIAENYNKELLSNYFTLSSYNRLFLLYIASYDHFNAEELYRKLLPRYEGELAGLTNSYYSFHNNHLLLLFYGDKKSKGLEVANQLVAESAKFYEESDSLYLEMLNNLAIFEIVNQNYDSGLAISKKVLDLKEARYGVYSSVYLKAMRNYADSLEKAERREESLLVWKDIKNIAKKLYNKKAGLYIHAEEKIEELENPIEE